MARIPQIPQPEIKGRPDKSYSGESEVPTVSAVTAPLESASRMAANLGDDFEALQRQRDRATAELKAKGDALHAELLSTRHETALGQAATELQSQNWDTPSQYPEALRKKANEIAANTISSQTDPEVAIDLAKKLAEVNNRQVVAAHGWMVHRMAGQAKNDFTQTAQAQVRSAQEAITVPGLAATIAETERKLGGETAEQVHGGNAAKVMSDLRQHMAVGWAEANATKNPVGVQDAIKSGALLKWITPEENEKLAHRLQGVQKRFGTDQRGQIAREAIDQGQQVVSLIRDGQLDSKTLFPMRIALQNKLLTIEHNPQLVADEKTEQSKILHLQLDNLRWAETITQQPKHDETDEKVATGLYKRLDALSSPTDKSPKDIFQAFQLQHDILRAEAKGDLSSNRADAMHRDLKLTLGSDLAKTATAAQSVTALPAQQYTNRSPRWVGSSALESYMNMGALGTLSEAQQNQARHDFKEWYVQSRESGAVVDERAAKTMALRVLRNVTAKGQQGK